VSFDETKNCLQDGERRGLLDSILNPKYSPFFLLTSGYAPLLKLRIMDLIKPNFEEGGVGDVPTRGRCPLDPHSSIRILFNSRS
jgi:hypothetical protein